MAQKHLFKAGKKNPKKAKKAANRHGKVIKMKKGNFVLPPTGKKDKEKWKSELRTTRVINAFNEKGALTKAVSQGDSLTLLKQPKGEPSAKKK